MPIFLVGNAYFLYLVSHWTNIDINIIIIIIIIIIVVVVVVVVIIIIIKELNRAELIY
jgi:hypothetical protein